MLHLNQNRLKKIPETIGSLAMLQTLNIASNSLKELPESLSKLARLKTFDVTYNPKLNRLPKSLAHCHAIEKLGVTCEEASGGNGIQYPPTDVCQKGTVAIMQFLCKGKTCIMLNLNSQ